MTRSKLHLPARLVALLLPLLLLGCLRTENPTPTVSPSPIPSPTAEPGVPSPSPSPTASPNTSDAQNEQVLQVYWLTTKANQVSLSPAAITLSPESNTPEARLKAGFQRLLKGPANADVTSSIPKDTELMSVKVAEDGVHVDFTQSFTQGGGSTSMQGRLGQVIYTASSMNPDVPVWISVEGEPLEVLGGEGLEVSQPITRQDFEKNFAL